MKIFSVSFYCSAFPLLNIGEYRSSLTWDVWSGTTNQLEYNKQYTFTQSAFVARFSGKNVSQIISRPTQPYNAMCLLSKKYGLKITWNANWTVNIDSDDDDLIYIELYTSGASEYYSRVTFVSR